MASTFSGFTPEVIKGMELSYDSITGLLFWYEGVLKLEKQIGEQGEDG